MRISELSRRTAVPVGTIKFYVREGLLPPGTTTARNQAKYDTGHEERLRLIRIFVDIGGLTLSSIRAILAAIDDEHVPLNDLCRIVHRAMHGERLVADALHAAVGHLADARDTVDSYLESLGWVVAPDAPERDIIASVLAILRRLGWAGDETVLGPYAQAADELAAFEMASVTARASRAETAVALVTRTVLLEVALVGLRRLAEEHHLSVHFRGSAPPNG
ncbi:MerR family transcriptional regulator [Micromonospora sp. SL1-18]|uniref:MerR family transcriptional regulator n=1 Tax=Micromonospora sp. SL1-18 TaxID=3399128 RepID=UPI003A4DC49A